MAAPAPAPKKRHRPALIVLALVAAGACLALAWWQWSRFESTAGTYQNLGYALQWPAFAIAVIYAYRRFVVMDADPDATAEHIATKQGPSEIPEGVLPTRPGTSDPAVAILDEAPDEALTEYNRHLNELNQRDDAR